MLIKFNILYNKINSSKGDIFKMGFYEIDNDVNVFTLGAEQTLFKGVVNFQKVILTLHDGKLVADTFDEKYVFMIDEILDVSFLRFSKTLVTTINTTKGKIVCSQSYKEYKKASCKELFSFLRPKFVNGKMYDHLINSKLGFFYALFGR